MTKREVASRLLQRGWVLTLGALAGLVIVYTRVAFFTPIESTQGPAQKIFYVHVSSAWASLGAFAVTGILSLLYLWRRDRKLDTVAGYIIASAVVLAYSVSLFLRIRNER
jgi:ABC-type transport system involved in cytochrome c biogenesis permease subunit